ncbi:MAG: thermonuclease family protein [Planctomycetes bacterium]|nr:thermonuclease family protein [Planctomycetota bacterium]
MVRSERRYSRGYRALWLWLVVAALLALRYFSVEPPSPDPELVDQGMVPVRRVIDGDTLLLASGGRLRLQGLDAPETVKENHPVERWGPEASKFTKEFMANAGWRVRLTFGLERKDQYDRLLAFVWNGDRLLNEELVRAGLARAKLSYRYSGRMKRRLADAQDDARRAGRGIWSDATTPDH